MYINKTLSDLRYSTHLYLTTSVCIRYTDKKHHKHIHLFLFHIQYNLIVRDYKDSLRYSLLPVVLIMLFVIICTLCDLVWHLEDVITNGRNMFVNSMMKHNLMVGNFWLITLSKFCPYEIFYSDNYMNCCLYDDDTKRFYTWSLIFWKRKNQL